MPVAAPVLDALATELPNIRAAVESAATSDPEAGLRLVTALTLFWVFTGRYREGDTCYARALDAANEKPTVLRGRAMAGRATLGHYGGAGQAAHSWAQAALDIGETCADVWTQARVLNTLGLKASLGDPSGGRPLLQRSVELATQAGDDWCRIDASNCLAIGWIFQDGFDTVRTLLDDLRATATQYRWGLPWSWLCLGWEAIYQGRLAEARELLARCVAVSDEVGLPITNGLASGFLTYVHLAGGNTELAYSLANTTLKRVQETGAGLIAGMAQQMLGATLMARGELAAARDNLATAVDLERRTGFDYAPSWHLVLLGSLERVEGKLEDAQAGGEEALEVALRLGSGWLQAAAERLLGRLALAARGGCGRRAIRPPGSGSLGGQEFCNRHSGVP